jgi:acyl dehydratase
MIGVWLRRDAHWPAIREPLSRHDIRRWSLYAVGDDNPLFTDESYGRRSVWGDNIAPPSFLYSVDSTIVGPGLPGIQWIHGGNRWELYDVVRPGDVITSRARVIDVKEKRGSHVPRFIIQVGEVLYLNQNGKTVARSEADCLRVPRAGSGQGFRGAGFDDRKGTGRQTYSPDEIAAIANEYLTEYRRGSEVLYWEDVREGDALPTLLKGPLTLVDIMAFYAGRRQVYNPLKLAFLERARHPANVYVSPQTGIPVHPAAGHLDVEIAHEVGYPDAYDQGWMRVNWAGHLVTNWCGDWAHVRQLNVKNSLPNLLGDLTRYGGRVVERSVDDGEHLVTLELWAENQRGERTTTGTSVVRFPSRDVTDRFLS